MADESNGVVSIENYDVNARKLEHLLTSDPDFAKAYRALIRKSLQAARRKISSDIKFSNAIKKDPRAAYKAVKTSVYKSIFGGNISILSRKKASNTRTTYAPPRTLKAGQRGGNRRKITPRTLQVMSYYGIDRGFILRWLEEGTNERLINFKADGNRAHIHRGSRGGDVSKYGVTVNTGKRGSLKAKNVFSNHAGRELEIAVDEISDALVEYINSVEKD